MTRTFFALTALFASSAALAGGATTMTLLEDDFCSSVERPFGTLTSCGGFDGVLHGTDTPSGIRVRTFIGDRWMDIYLNDTLIDSTSLSGQLILVDDEEPGVLVNHQSFCRSFLTPDGDPVHVSVDSMIVDGEGIYFDVSEVDSCD
jgi:hypothetical protein